MPALDNVQLAARRVDHYFDFVADPTLRAARRAVPEPLPARPHWLQG